MARLKIKDAPLLPVINGDEKIPTGGKGDFTLTPNMLAEHFKSNSGFATDAELVVVDNKLKSHTDNKNNPHQTTKEQVGLGSVDNTSDIDKPVSNATSIALDTKADKAQVIIDLNLKADKITTYTKTEVDSEFLSIYQNGAALPYDAVMEYAENAHVVKDGELQKKQGTSWVSAINKGYNLDYFVSGKSYPLHAEIMLENGDIVKSTVSNNTIDPNVDMTGWVKTNSAGYIELSNGSNVQQFFDDNKLKDYAFVTPEMFGDTVTDASDAINAAFATGKRVEFDPDKTYSVTKEIITKGQELGFVKFNSSRKHQGKVAYGFVENKGPIKKEDIKFIYVQISYDLIEFLKIKSLGFNTIVHYFQNADTTKFPIILDNAKAAGLDVVVVTEQIGSGNTVTPAVAAAFIQTIDSHPAVVGYYLFDEPVGRNISFATQNAMIDAVKAVTTKPLWVGENYFKTSHVLLPSAQLPTRYDIYSIHQYAERQDSGIALATRINNDLNTARKYFSVFKSIYGELLGKTVIPAVGLFSPPSDADKYTKDKAQVVGLADRYSFASEGHRGCFIWDALLENIAVTPEYQAQAIKHNAAYRTKNRNPNNYAVVFGSVDGGYNFGINQVSQMGSAVRNTDAEIGRLHAVANAGNAGMYGVFSPSAGNYSGILYRNANTAFLSHFRVARYLTVTLAITDIDGLTAGLLTNLYITRDKGITKALLYSGGLTNIQGTFEQGGGAGELIIEVQTTTASPNYRRLVSGVIMSTDW